MPIKTYGATRNQAIAQALSSSITNLEGLQKRQAKVIDDLISDFLRKQQDFFGNTWDIVIDSLGSLASEVWNGTADFISGAELIYNQFVNDVTQGNPNEVKLIEDEINNWTYAFVNAGTRVFQGGESFFTGILGDAVKYGYDLIKMMGMDTKQIDMYMPAVQTISMAKDDPLADLINMYGKGGAFDNLDRFWTARRAEVLTQLGRMNVQPINQDMTSDMRNERNQAIVEATYGEAFLKKQLDITNATSARREFVTKMFENERVTQMIAQGGSLGQAASFFRGVFGSVGRILPTIAISNAVGALGKAIGATGQTAAALATVGKVAGNIYFASSIFGMSMEEALKNGASYDDALTYAFGSAVSETAVESVSGFVIGEGLSAATFKEFINDAVNEGLEEIAAEFGSRGLARFKNRNYLEKQSDGTYKDIRNETSADFWQRVGISFLSGAASGGILGLPGFVKSQTIGGSTQKTTEALSQSIQEKGAKQFSEDAAPRIQKTLKQLNNKRVSDAQKKTIMNNPYIQKVIQFNKKTNTYELTQVGQRIVDTGMGKTQDTLEAMQGKNVISKNKYVISGDLFLQNIQQTITVPSEVEGQKSKKVKINILTNKTLNTLPKARQLEVRQIQETFGNVVFVDMPSNSFNAFTDPKTGTIYVNVNSNKGIKNVYAHEVHDYLYTLAQKGTLPKKAAKAFFELERAISVITSQNNKNLPKSIQNIIQFVKENYAEKEWSREIGSFIIQEILTNIEGGTNFVQEILNSRDSGLRNFIDIFRNEVVAKELFKKFKKVANLPNLLRLMENRLNQLFLQSDTLLQEQEGLRLTLAFANTPLFSLSREDELNIIADMILNLENSAFTNKDALLKAIRDRNRTVVFKAIAKNNSLSDFAIKELLFDGLGMYRVLQNILENMSVSDMEVKVPSLLNVLSKEKLIEYGFNESNLELFKTRPALFGYILRQLSPLKMPAESTEAIENLKEALLDMRGIRIHKEGSMLRSKGYIFSNSIGAFSIQDFERVGNMFDSLGDKLYAVNYFWYDELFSIFNGKFEFTLNKEGNQDVTFTREFSITPSILDLQGNVVRKNPKMMYSSLSAITLEQLVDTGVLPSQSFGMHNFGIITSPTHQFAQVEYKYKEEYTGDKKAFVESEKVPLDEQFYATIVLKNSVLRDSTFVGQRDMFTPTKVMNVVDKTKYKLKFDQHFESSVLEGEYQPLSRDLDINDELEAFKLTMRYVKQSRRVWRLSKNEMDTTLGERVPGVTQQTQEDRLVQMGTLNDAQYFLTTAALTNELMKMRQNKESLKYEIELANLGVANKIFLQKTSVTEFYQTAVESLETIRNSIKSGEMTFEQFLSIYEKLSPEMISRMRDVFFENISVEELVKEKPIADFVKNMNTEEAILADRYFKELASLAFFNSLTEYSLNEIAEGQGTVKTSDVAVITLTRVMNTPKRSKLYQKTLDWAKANNIRVVENVLPRKSVSLESSEVSSTQINLKNTNAVVKQQVLNGEDVLFSKADDFDTTEVDFEMLQEAKEISEKYPELENVNKLKPLESIVDVILDKYGYENYLNIYNYTGDRLEIFGQRYVDLTDDQRRATGEAIKMFYKNFIMQHLDSMESVYGIMKSNRKSYKSIIALAIDTFLEIEFNDNLSTLRKDLKKMRPFSRDVLYANVNRLFRSAAGDLLKQGISMMDTFQGIARKDVIPFIAGIYQSYRNVTQGKQVESFETKFGGVQYTTFKQMDDLSLEYLQFFHNKVMNNEKGLVFEPESQTVSSIGDNFNKDTMAELLNRENISRIQNLHNPITFSSKRKREMSLYELGYDYAIYSTDKYDNGIVFGFKSSDFHVGPNAIAKNIQFNFDGVAPYFTYDVLDFSQDGLVRYRTSVRVAPAIVTKNGRAIENPVYFESGVGLNQIEMLLDGIPLVNQSATISSIADTNNYIYSYEKPTDDFGFGSTVRFTIQVDPKAMNNDGVGVVDKDGNYVNTKTISQRVDFFSPSKTDLQEILKKMKRTEKLQELSQKDLLGYLAVGTALNVSSLITAENSISQSNPFQEVDEFKVYLDMDSMTSLASLIFAGGLNQNNFSSTISDVKSTMKRTRGAKEAAAVNDLIENFYDTALSITSDQELINKFFAKDAFTTKALLIKGFAQALNDIYYQNKGNLALAMRIRAGIESRPKITQEIINKYGASIKRVSRAIDFLPYNYNNFNETVFTKLPKDFVPTIVMKVYGPTDSFSKVLESDKFKELEKKAKESNIKIKVINLTQFTQDMGSMVTSQVNSLIEDLNQQGIEVNQVDIGTLKQLQQEFSRNQVAQMIKDSEVEVKKEVLGDIIEDDSPVMFSKADRIKKSNKAKARFNLNADDVIKVQVKVPEAFKKTAEEVEKAKKTRTKVSKVNFDTEYGRLDKGVPLYSLLTKVTKQLRALIETQRFFGREYQEEGAVISRAIQELNKVKKEIESILGLKEPVKPFDANLDADQGNMPGISTDKLLAYRDEVFAMTLDKKSTANITSQIEQELFRVIDGYKKEALGVLEAQSESQVIARPTEAILDTKIFEALKDTPQFKLLMSLVKTYNYLQNKVASSFFIEQKQQLKNYASEVKIRIQNTIASLFDKANMPGFNPFELTKTQQYKDAPLTFSKEVDDAIQKAMYDMTSDEAQKSYKYYNEAFGRFKQALDSVANDAQNQVLNGIETYTATNQEIATKVDEVIEPTGQRLTRRAKKGEVQYVYRMLLGQRLKHAEKMKNSAKTDDGKAFWSRVYESTAIAYQRAMRGEVKIPKEDLQIPQVHKTIQKLRKEFIASKDVPDMKKFIEDNAKSFVVTEEVSVVRAREKQEAYQQARLEEKQFNTERKKKSKPGDAWRDYTGPSYVSLNDIKYSVGLQTNIGRVDFNKLKGLKKGREVTVVDEKVVKTYSPNTKKAYALQVEQAKVVEAKREVLVKAQQVKEKPGYNNKPKAFKEKTEKAIVKAKQEYKEAKDKLLYFKTTAELMMSKEKTPPLKTTVGQKVYFRPGVEITIKETGEKKAFFKIEDAQKWLNSKIHNKTLQERGETVAVIRDANEILQPHDDVQEVAIINRMEIDQDDAEAKPAEVKPITPQVKVAKKNQWKPTEDLIIEYNGVEYTYTLADMQKMIANGNFNFETKQDFIDYQATIIEATIEEERKAQVAEQQQAETRATLQQATGSLNAPIAAPTKKVNIFKEIQANVLSLDPNHYRNQEKAFGDTINVRIAELRSRKKLSKGERILLGLFEQLQQTVNGYSSNDRVYNHVSMAVGKVLVLWLDKFYRGTNAKGKIRVPSKSELKDLEIQVVQAVFGALNYVDSELRVEINKTEGNPNGYLYTKAVYWYLRDMLKVTKWDAQTTEAFAKDGNGDGFRRVINAIRNFTVKGYGISELIGAFNELDGDTAVPPITDMALREEEGARTLPTAARQWIQNSTENQDIAQEAGFDLRTSIGTDYLDPYTVSEIVSLFQEDGWGLALQRRLIEGQDRMFMVDDVFDNIFDEKWVKKNRKKLIELEKNKVNVSNLGDAKIPMSQIIYLRGMLMREIMRNRLIELGIIKGEKTFHFQNGGVIDVLAIRDNKAEAKDKAKQYKIVDAQALLLELTDIINGDAFAKQYTDKIYEMINKMYPMVNERFKEIHGAHLVNDGDSLRRELPNLSQTQREKLERLLPKGMTLDTLPDVLYMPFLLSSGNYFNPNKVSFKDVLNAGVFDGLTENLKDTNGVVSVESVTNMLNTYRQEVRNYYGLHRIMRDLSLLLNFPIQVGNNTSTLQTLLPEWAIEYYRQLLIDMAGYGVVQSPSLFKKWLPFIRQNFYVTALGFNVKVITTQFATVLNLWHIYGQGNPVFLAKMLANMAKRATPQNKAKLEEMANKVLIYKDRKKGATFEIGEATKEGVRGKSIIETLKEFSMKGIQLTDNMINEAFYLTLLESINPKTGNVYTEQEAREVLKLGIIRSQSNRQALAKAPLLRSKNELVRILVKFMGEPMKHITQLASSATQMSQITKIEKSRAKIEQRAQGKVDAAKVKLQEEKEKLQKIQATENNPAFASESASVQEKIVEDRKLQQRRVQEEERKVREAEQAQQRVNSTVSKIVGQKREALRLFKGRLSAATSVVTFLAALAASFEVFKTGFGEDDDERDPNDAFFTYLLKKFGSKFLDEMIGMMPFVRDAYATIIKGYDYGTIGEMRGVNTMMLAMNGIFRAMVEGETVNWNRLIYNFALGASELTGLPLRNIEQLIKTPLQYISEPAYYQYNNWIGGKDTDNQELVEAIRDNDTAMISVIIDNKIAKRNLIVHKDIKDEIKRLAGAGFSVSMVGIPNDFVQDGATVKLTNEQKKEFAEVYNQADYVIRRLFTSGQYRRLSDKYKARLIQAVYDYYYKYAKQDVLGIDTLSEELTFVSLNQAYTYFIGRAEAYRNMQLKDRERDVPTIIA